MNYEKWYGLTVYDMLKKACDIYGDKNIFSYMENGMVKEVTYRKLLKDVHTVAGHFEKMNLKGKYVVIEGKTEYEIILAMYAVISVGAVAVMLNFDISDAEIDRVFDAMSPALIITGTDGYELMEKYAERTGVYIVSGKNFEDRTSIQTWIDKEEMEFEYSGEYKPEDPALVLLTSGSTGQSKHVLLSHYAFLPRKEYVTEKTVAVFPLYHIAGMSLMQVCLAYGIEAYLSNMKEGLRDIEWFRPTEIVAVPAFVSLMVNRSKQGLLDLSSFSCINTGAAPQNMEVVQFLAEKGIVSYSSYGATETSGTVTYTSKTENRAGSVGKPGPWNEIKFAENGEILVRGKNVMLGYVGNEDGTAEALCDGWYHTGDVGRLDEDGYLYIVGRIKNIIILSNGENVSPEAVEAQLNMCEEIDEVVVKGEDDIIVAYVWCGENASEERKEQVERYIKMYNKNVPSYHRVRKTVFRETPFEKTATGKIKR